MLRRSLLWSSLVLGAIVSCAAYWTWGPSLPWSVAWVSRVVDGDTIEVNRQYRIRYIGANAPETVHPSKPVECYGPEASQRNKKLVGNRVVLLTGEARDRDDYRRLLRYVYSLDGTMVNRSLLAEGYAYYASYGDAFRFQREFLLIEKAARENRRGLWSACMPTTREGR